LKDEALAKSSTNIIVRRSNRWRGAVIWLLISFVN